MSIPKHIKEHAMLGVGLGENVKTVGLGGAYSTVAAAVASIGDRFKLRSSETAITTTLTNGSPTVTFVGTSYFSTPSTTKPRIDDLIQFRAEGRYYKILSIDSNTQITLYEDYEGTTASAVSMDYGWYYLDWITLLILGGEHNIDGISIPSGYVFTGFGESSNTMSEISVTKGSPFNTLGECVFKDLTIAPTAAWGSLDAIVRQNQTPDGSEFFWAGQTLLFDSCRMDSRSLDGSHMEGNVSYPFIPKGNTIYRNCRMKNDNAAKFLNMFGDGGTPIVPATAADTNVSCIGCSFEYAWGWGWDNITFKHGIWLNEVANYLFKDCSIDSIIDIPLSSLFPALVGGVYIDSACVATFANTRIRNSIPSASQPSHGILVTDGATVNIDNADIEVDDDGVQCTHASGVINIRGGRVKGGVNALQTTAGAINYDNNVTLIGGTTGAGVTNTPT